MITTHAGDIAPLAMPDRGGYIRTMLHHYPGGKGHRGTHARIISEIPPHDFYLEPFAGNAAVFRAKRNANVASVLWELDPAQAARLRAALGCNVRESCGLAGAVEYVRNAMSCNADPERIVCYFDPPYLMSTRKSKRRVYHREWSDSEHAVFLDIACELPCVCIVSHYPCALYAERLAHWRSFTFTVQTRNGRAVEQVWINRPPFSVVHDARYLGDTFRGRERLRRQVDIIVRRFDALPVPGRIALLEMLEERIIRDAGLQPAVARNLKPTAQMLHHAHTTLPRSH